MPGRPSRLHEVEPALLALEGANVPAENATPAPTSGITRPGANRYVIQISKEHFGRLDILWTPAA
jgi:hypothetical protein